MVVLFILMMILGAFAFIGGVITLVDSFDGTEALMGFISLVFGIGLFIGGLAGGANYSAKYDEETVRLCDKQNGIVSQDGHCFVDNKPVEFSPGVWER
jgi:hypothetical protein